MGVAAGAAGAKPPEPKPPRVTLLTGTERGALRDRAVKVLVESRKGDSTRVEARLVVDGFPEDFVFSLGPEKGRLRDGEARVRLKLSARKLEVLDFAAQTCRGASLGVSARVEGRLGTTSGGLRRPGECRTRRP